MDIKQLRGNTEKLVVLLDLYERIEENRNITEKSTVNIKSNFVKDKLLLSILENKKLCENIIFNLESEIKK
jgi:hypothetical protein